MPMPTRAPTRPPTAPPAPAPASVAMIGPAAMNGPTPGIARAPTPARRPRVPPITPPVTAPVVVPVGGEILVRHDGFANLLGGGAVGLVIRLIIRGLCVILVLLRIVRWFGGVWCLRSACLCEHLHSGRRAWQAQESDCGRSHKG